MIYTSNVQARFIGKSDSLYYYFKDRTGALQPGRPVDPGEAAALRSQGIGGRADGSGTTVRFQQPALYDGALHG
jgi:hypothetical protein